MVVAADAARRILICDGCGYGISVVVEPPACPMCRSETWVVPAVAADRDDAS